jgi:hypothetical protein
MLLSPWMNIVAVVGGLILMPFFWRRGDRWTTAFVATVALSAAITLAFKEIAGSSTPPAIRYVCLALQFGVFLKAYPEMRARQAALRQAKLLAAAQETPPTESSRRARGRSSRRRRRRSRPA